MNGEFVFEALPHPQCHASTVAESAGGIVAAWFGGTHERNPDVGIWFARRDGGGWSAPVEVANGVHYTRADGTHYRHPCWNPVLFQPRDGPLMLFYKVGPPAKWWGMLITSTDGGRNWSEPRRLPEEILGPIKNKPVQLADGTILAASSTENSVKPTIWRTYFERTSDLGKTWQMTEAIHDGLTPNTIQGSILFHSGRRLQTIGRTKQSQLFETWSSDEGRTWSAPTLLALPNPNSGTDAVTLADGRQLLVYNHATMQPDGKKGPRSPLNVAVSRDGKNWEAALVLEDGPGEYSYPAVIQAADGAVHITYTWKRERIKHVVLDPTKLRSVPMIDGQWPVGNTIMP